MSSAVRIVAAFTAAIGLAACTMIPAYERPPSTVETSYPGVASTEPAHTADVEWRTFFREPRLARLIETALANNKDLQVAVLRVEQSQAQYRITRSSSVPSVDATGGLTRTNNGLSNVAPAVGQSTLAGSTSSIWSASVGVTSYELDLFGRLRSLNRQAQETFLATDETRRSAQIALVAEVATQYFALREAEEQLRLAEQTLEAVQGSCELTRATYGAGASNELDLRTAEGQVQAARNSVLAYGRQRATAGNGLVLLLGQAMPDGLPDARPLSDLDLLAAILPGLPSELIERRADVLEAEHTLKAANASIGAARAAFFPQITLTGSTGSTSTELSKLFGSGSGTWSFSPQLSVPLFAGGKLTAELDVARVGRQIEVANYQKAIQTAFREVADALADDEAYAEQIDAETKLTSAERRRYELANVRYRAGEESYVSVLSAQQDLYSAQQSLLQAGYNRLASHIALYKALGGGWQ